MFDPSKTKMHGVVAVPAPPEDTRPFKRWALVAADGTAFPVVTARDAPKDPGTWEEVADTVQPLDKKVGGAWVKLEQTAGYWRNWRDSELAASDWMVARATETGTPMPQAWADFRQECRDIPEQAGFPTNVTRPVRPQA